MKKAIQSNQDANASNSDELADYQVQAGKLKTTGGSASDEWNLTLVLQTVEALWLKGADDEARTRQMTATIAALRGIEPKDELEGMMSAQLLAAHNAAMECYRRAMISNQTFEGRQASLNQANKLSRTWASLLDALNKHRGKGQQKVTVEHVHVHSGGQAVVGTVETLGGGAQSKMEEQPHARQIAHAPEPEMWREDTTRVPVPFPGDG